MTKMNQSEEVAIIGLAGRFPGAGSPAALWANVRDNVDSVSQFTNAELLKAGIDPFALPNPDYIKAEGVLADIDLFDASFFGYSPRDAELLDPQVRVLMECAWEALEDAGYDSERNDERIGVFAGAGMNTYLLTNLLPRFGLTGLLNLGSLAINTGNDFLATQICFGMDLRGPGITVQTACSTSLVAVHLACQSLFADECSIALAGASAIRVPQLGYVYQNGVNAPDGICKAFDSAANGTVPGNGAGIVVLKKLAAAIADRDHIYAVIKGSAINNDGSRKSSFTAPSLKGQQEMLTMAFARANVEPETISYIEAHGTGTIVGDPIELAALISAFPRTAGTHSRCAIGSLKPNIGHLDAAAGIAGLIKTAMALQHRVLPPLLHFSEPSRDTDLRNSSLYINTKAIEWVSDSSPRRAGVSAFGMGGTNSHVILEEAPSISSTARKARPWQLMVLSGKTESAVQAITSNLVDHLIQNPECELADIAYTHQIGRRAFMHRRAIVCHDISDTISALETLDSRRVSSGTASKDASTVFMFPGQGSQHINMAGELYYSEQTFRHDIDRCAAMLLPELGIDIREILYPDTSQSSEATERLNQTAITQPLLFVIEYALANLWMRWGVAPTAMIGHSLGEYVIGCLAGVFSLDDALSLVAARGRLMQSLPEGGMIAVPLSVEEVTPFLKLFTDVDVAAINAPSLCILAGPAHSISALQMEFRERDVAAVRLGSSTAFHSSLVDSILGEFLDLVRSIKLSPPNLPWVSTATGTWITGDEATDPGYWAKHMRDSVRFSDAAAVLLKMTKSVFLEVGPGETLTNLLKRQPGWSNDTVALSSLALPTRDQTWAAAHIFHTLGKLWVNGISVDWSAFWGDEQRSRVSLPTYPFERRRYWVDPATNAFDVAADLLPSAIESVPQSVSTAVSSSAHPRPTLAVDYLAPSNDVEKSIAAIWQDLLGIDVIGINDNFLELGGNSLLGMQFISRLRQLLQVRLPLSTLTGRPTIAEFAQEVAITQVQPDQEPMILPSAISDPQDEFAPFAMTDLAQAYWLGRSKSFDFGGVGSHYYCEIEAANLDIERLNYALLRLIERHNMLRAVILPEGQQQVLDSVPPYHISSIDLRNFDDTGKSAALQAVREEIAYAVPDATQWPLFEVRASQLDSKCTIIHLRFDYLIFDALTLETLSREWAVLYRQHDATLLPIGLTYRDYTLTTIEMRQSVGAAEAREYWDSRLTTLPPPPQLPTIASPNTLPRHRLTTQQASLDADTWNRFQAWAAKFGLTPSTALCAAFAEILALWSEYPHFTLNLPVFSRFPIHPQVNELIGSFTSNVLLEVDTSTETSFAERARQLQHQLWQDLEHRIVGGVEVMRELGRLHSDTSKALMPVIFTSLLSNDSPTNSWAIMEWLGKKTYRSNQAPQIIIDHQVEEVEGTLVFYWDALEEVFPQGTLREMFDAYTNLLHRMASSDAAWQSTRPVTTAQHEQRRPFGLTGMETRNQTLYSLFAEQAEHQPSRPAIISSTAELSYQELRIWSNRIGRLLNRLGARPNTLVAIVMDKGWEQVAAVLGILQSGAAYLPISPALPKERIWHLLERGEVSLVLTQDWVDERLDWPSYVQRIHLTEGEFRTIDDFPLPTVQEPDDLAYVIFTSGSTGLPKGVAIDHRGAVNTILDVNCRFSVGPNDRALGLSSLGFDLSVYDIFGILAAGGTLILPDPSSENDPAHWSDLLVHHGVTIWNSVPALMEMLVEYLSERPVSYMQQLRLVLMSGDWIPITLPNRIQRLFPDAQRISMGGATEASIWSILYSIGHVDPEWKSIPYGKSMTNQTFYVLNQVLESCPTNVAGELYIGGIGLAKGYWRDADKTAASFITHSRTGERLYRTGDRGRMLPSGNIEFLGRTDHQIKIRGYRIELGEIEATLSNHGSVRDAVVVVQEGNPNGQQLVAFVIPSHASPPMVASIASHEHVAHWRTVFDELYAQSSPQHSSTLDTVGWTSSYTGDPIPVSQMREQVDATVERILELNPNSILEIGCGTGMLLYRLAPHCSKYKGTDISAVVLRNLAERVRLMEPALAHVQLLEQPANDFSEMADDEVDAVVINSVTQYFPDINYLQEVLSEAVRVTREGGIVFVGDVRSLPLLECFYLSTLLHQPSTSYSRAEVMQQIQTKLENESELVIDPSFFEQVPEWLPAVGRVEVLLKRGLSLNEVTKYRYDVIIHVGTQGREQAISWLKWDTDGLSIPVLRRVLAETALDGIGIADVPNARLVSDARALLLLYSKHEDDNNANLAIENASSASDAGVDPEKVWGLGEQLSYNVRVCPASSGVIDRFDAVFTRAGSALQSGRIPTGDGGEANVDREQTHLKKEFYVTTPLHSRVRQTLTTILRRHLQERLPHYMVPSSIVVLDSFPLNANGKVDRGTLQFLTTQRGEDRVQTESPQTMTEKTLLQIWGEVLNTRQINLDDSFFELGGDSLLATRAVSRIREAFGVDLPLRALFESPTVTKVGLLIDSSR